MVRSRKRKPSIKPEHETVSAIPPTPPSKPGLFTPVTQKNPKSHPKVWSKCDVIVIIKGMVDFIANFGVDPFINLDSFVDFINNNNNNNNSVSCRNKIKLEKITWNLLKLGGLESNYVLHLDDSSVVKNLWNCDGGVGASSVLNGAKTTINGKESAGGVGGSGVVGEKGLNWGNCDGRVGGFSVPNVAQKKSNGCGGGEKGLILGNYNGGVGGSSVPNGAKKKSNWSVVGCEKKLNLCENDGGVGCSSVVNSVKEESGVGGKKVDCIESLGALSGCSIPNSTKKKSGVGGKMDCIENVGGVSGCSSVPNSAKKKSSFEGEMYRIEDVCEIDCMSSLENRERKSNVDEKKLKSRVDNGKEKCTKTENNMKNSNAGVKNSKSRGRGGRRRRRKIGGIGEKKPILGNNEDGVSCSSIPSSVGGKRSKSRTNNGGERWELKTDNGGEKCTKPHDEMKKKKKSSGGDVKSSRSRARVRRKTPAIILVGKKRIWKAKKYGGKKQNNENTVWVNSVLEAKKGGIKNNDFGFLNENMKLEEAMRRMISRRVSLSDELQADISWCPPKIGVLKWNTDASLREDHRSAAIGGVLRDWQGSFRCVFSCPVDCFDSNEVEVRAIYKALELASSKDWLLSLNMVIESDSMNAVTWCNEDNGGPLNLGYMLSFIHECRRWWPGLEITYMGRKSNSVADRLAKQGHQRRSDFIAWM